MSNNDPYEYEERLRREALARLEAMQTAKLFSTVILLGVAIAATTVAIFWCL